MEKMNDDLKKELIFIVQKRLSYVSNILAKACKDVDTINRMKKDDRKPWIIGKLYDKQQIIKTYSIEQELLNQLFEWILNYE